MKRKENMFYGCLENGTNTKIKNATISFSLKQQIFFNAG
jgi:hypothetical protein